MKNSIFNAVCKTRYLALLVVLIFTCGNAWGGTATLSQSAIKSTTPTNGANGYASYSISSGGYSWSAYAIKNQHSNATSGYHFLQIKKYGSSTAYYVQIPTMPGNISSITVTVSNTSQPMTGGGNSATLYFSSSNSTSSTGTGVVSGTGSSSITLDCSSLKLKTGYITASAGIRIWELTVTYDDAASVATPTFSPAAGTYTSAQSVTISCATAESTIYYTTDGTTPTSSSTVYSSAISISSSCTLKAIAKKGSDYSSVASASYTINIPYTVSFSTGTGNPSVSPVTETEQGEGIALPAGPTPACSDDGWAFAGWGTEEVDDVTVAPALLLEGDYYTPDGADETLYAVYRKETGDDPSTATFNAGDLSDLTQLSSSTTKPAWYKHTASGIEFYVGCYGIFSSTFDIDATGDYCDADKGVGIIDGFFKIKSVTCTATTGYLLGSVDKNAGSASLGTSGTTQTITCSGDVTRLYLSPNTTNNESRLTTFTVTYYNAKFNSNPTCKDVKSIAITTTPTKTTYCAGETFDPAGMEIRVTYTDDSSNEIAYDEHEGDFSFSPSTSTSLTTGNSSVTVTYREKDASQAITVNASRTISLTGSGTVTGGTFSADNSTACVGATITLTATPSTHYSLGSWTVTKAGGGMVEVTSNQFIMPDEDVTVNATFTEDPYRTVVFKNSGSSLYSGDGFDATNKWKQKVYVGEAPVWPTALTDGTANDACDATSDKFYGWASNTWSGTLDDTDALDGWDGGNVYTSGPLATVVAGSGDIEYHAIWAEAVGVPSNEYQLVTSISQLNAGDKIVIAGAKTTSTYLLGYQRHTDAGYHFRPQSSNAYTITSSKVTLTSSDIAAIASDETHPYVLTLGKNGDYWTFYDAVNGGYLCATTADKNELNVRAEDSDGASRFTISISSDAASITSQVTPESTPHNLLQYLTNTFSCYKSTSGGTNPYIFRNLSTLGYQKFLTTCCDKKVTLSEPVITDAASSGSTVTYTESSAVATCDGAKEVHVTITPAAGYQATSISFGGTATQTGVSPAISTPLTTAQTYTISYAKEINGTLVPTVTFEKKTATAWTWTYNSGAIPDPLVLYVGINKQLDVTYEPADLLNDQKNYSVTKESSVAEGGKGYAYYKMRGAAGVSAETNSTVTFTLNGLSQTVNVTVKPQPKVYFVDIVHNETFDPVMPAVASFVANFVRQTPTHADVAEPGTGNSCEKQHLHLIGWIRSDYSKVEDYLNGTGAKPSITDLTDAGTDGEGLNYYFEPNADINVEDYNGLTFYAVWAKK